MKEPGAGFNVKNVNMDFHYKDLADIRVPSAYERLLYDVMLGDSTLFSRDDEVETAWKFIEPIQKAWANNPVLKFMAIRQAPGDLNMPMICIDGEDHLEISMQESGG